jgi:hypothetical protein
MDIGKAFGFVFEDEKWVSKVLIGGLLIWIPIVNFAVFGYMLAVARNVAQSNPRPLPEWGEFGTLFGRGFYAFVIALVYLLPVFILEGLFFCLTGGLAAGVRRGGNGSGGAAIGLLGFCLVPLLIVLALTLSLLIYAALARFVATDKMSEAFKFSDVVAGVRANLSTWLVLWLVALLANFVGGLGTIACGVGVLFTAFYAYCVTGHALGQTIRQVWGSATDASIPPAGYGPPPTYQ